MKREEKKTFTYVIEPSIRDKAMRKAKREGSSLSEKIRDFVKGYAAPKKKVKGGIPLPDEFISLEKVYVVKSDGSTEPLFKEI